MRRTRTGGRIPATLPVTDRITGKGGGGCGAQGGSSVRGGWDVCPCVCPLRVSLRVFLRVCVWPLFPRPPRQKIVPCTGTMASFKEKHDLEKRREEADAVRSRHPDRVAIIVERAEGSKVPEIDKTKFLVPKDLTVGQFSYVVQSPAEAAAGPGPLPHDRDGHHAPHGGEHDPDPPGPPRRGRLPLPGVRRRERLRVTARRCRSALTLGADAVGADAQRCRGGASRGLAGLGASTSWTYCRAQLAVST